MRKEWQQKIWHGDSCTQHVWSHEQGEKQITLSTQYQLVRDILLVTDHEDSAQTCDLPQNICHIYIKHTCSLVKMWSFLLSLPFSSSLTIYSRTMINAAACFFYFLFLICIKCLYRKHCNIDMKNWKGKLLWVLAEEVQVDQAPYMSALMNQGDTYYYNHRMLWIGRH